MLSFIYRILYIISGYVLCMPLCAYSVLKNKVNFPKWAFYFDNKEDGYNGDKRNWYSNYLGYSVSKTSKLNQIWIAYKWCAWRNPVWNLRFHPYISVDVTKPESVSFEGNTFHHSIKWSFDKNDTSKKWYKVKTVFNGRKFTSRFYLIPIYKDTYLYLRFGLKIYPSYYLEQGWIDRIKVSGFPKNKTKGLYAISIRFRSLDKL